MNKFRACCGLNCETCEARIATINDDNEKRKAVADKWSAMNNEPSITPETINCLGCRTDDGCKFYFCSHLCEVRKCCMAHGYATCAECAERKTCAALAPFLDNEEVKEYMNGEE